jgi:hypothetical protein
MCDPTDEFPKGKPENCDDEAKFLAVRDVYQVSDGML